MYKSGQQCACVFLFIDKHMLKLIGCVNFVNALNINDRRRISLVIIVIKCDVNYTGSLWIVWSALGSFRLTKCSRWAWMGIWGTTFSQTRPAAARTAGMPGGLAAIRTLVTLLLVHMTSLNDLTCRSIHAGSQVGISWGMAGAEYL